MPMKWVMIILAANVLHLWMFLRLNLETHPVTSWIGIGMHIAACIGSFWMLYDWYIRRNKRTWKAWMWLVFVPWGFLWYGFEQYRPSRAVNE
jgi:uncharacterized membrane protein YbhN (UPF0104 family)